MKPIERQTARRMRRDEGRSVREIAALLGVSVASVSRWTADITLSSGFIEALRQRNSAWLGRLGLPVTSLRKSSVNRASSASRWRSKRGGLWNGQRERPLDCDRPSIYGAIQQYAGIERPDWVDGRLTSAAPP